MNRIELNHWFVSDNHLSISLINYCVIITILKNDEFIFYRLKVIDNNRSDLTFDFYSLEDAITFTEKTINKCNTVDDITNAYIRQFNDIKIRKRKK